MMPLAFGHDVPMTKYREPDVLFAEVLALPLRHWFD